VDDAQWLDRVSVQSLAFAAQRLLADRVEPSGERDLTGLPEVTIEGIIDRDALAFGWACGSSRAAR
jgi:hypothetical protein